MASQLNPKNTNNRSSPHLKVRELLSAAYPGFRVLEESPIEATVAGRRVTLRVDFWLPDLSLVIEVHGRQHDVFVRHFHRTPEGFERHKQRDREKERQVRAAGMALLILRDSELEISRTQFMRKVTEAIRERQQNG